MIASARAVRAGSPMVQGSPPSLNGYKINGDSRGSEVRTLRGAEPRSAVPFLSTLAVWRFAAWLPPLSAARAKEHAIRHRSLAAIGGIGLRSPPRPLYRELGRLTP